MPASAEDIAKVRKLLEKYGGEVDDFFKLWPTDKQYFFSERGDAAIAYTLNSKVAIALFDPNGADRAMPNLLEGFREYCRSQGWEIIFVQATDRYQKQFEAQGFNRLVIGADALINVETFCSSTAHNKYFRNLVNRMDKQGYSLDRHKPPHNKKILGELKVVSDDWLKLPRHREWHFLTGRFDEEYLQQVPLCILRDKAGRVVAFANELPSYKKGVISVDLMRHLRSAPPNCIDFLFIKLLFELDNSSIKWFNLGLSPIDGAKYANNGLEHLVNLIYKMFQSFIKFRGLHQYKAKWQPQWEPRYVWYTGRPLQLVRDGIAIKRTLTNPPDNI